MAGFLPPLIVELGASTGEFSAKMDEAMAKLGELDAESDTLGSKFSSFANKASDAIAGVGIAAIAAGTVMAFKYESQMYQMRAATGMTTAEMKLQTQALLNISDVTATSTDNLISGLTGLEQAGIRGAAADRELTTAAWDAQAGHASVAEEVQALITLMKTGLVTTKDYSASMAQVTAASHDTQGGLSAVTGALSGKAMVAFTEAGLHLNSLLPMIAMMSQVGYSGSRATRTLATELDKLIDPVQKTSASSITLTQELAQVGIHQDIVAAKLRGPEGLVGALGYVKQAMQEAGYTGSKMTVELQSLLGGASAAPLVYMIQHLSTLQSLGASITGTTQKSIIDSVTANPEFKLKQMEEELHTMLTRLGMIGLPLVIKAISFADSALQDIEHSTVLKDALAGVFAAALAYSIGRRIVGAVSSVKSLFGTSSTTAQADAVTGNTTQLELNTEALQRLTDAMGGTGAEAGAAGGAGAVGAAEEGGAAGLAMSTGLVGGAAAVIAASIARPYFDKLYDKIDPQTLVRNRSGQPLYATGGRPPTESTSGVLKALDDALHLWGLIGGGGSKSFKDVRTMKGGPLDADVASGAIMKSMSEQAKQTDLLAKIVADFEKSKDKSLDEAKLAPLFKDAVRQGLIEASAITSARKGPVTPQDQALLSALHLQTTSQNVAMANEFTALIQHVDSTKTSAVAQSSATRSALSSLVSAIDSSQGNSTSAIVTAIDNLGSSLSGAIGKVKVSVTVKGK